MKKIDFSELKGLTAYTFKKDKGVGVKIMYNKEDVFKLKDMYFLVYNESGDVLYKSSKDCFSVIEYKKTVKTGNLFFDRYTTVKAHKLAFKRNASGYSKEFNSFREFCANRKSGNEIYNLFMQELSAVSGIFDIAELSNVFL